MEVAPFPMPRSKSNRADSSGRVCGIKDYYVVVDGQLELTFEPFWFRTFRYIQLKITASEQSLTLGSFTLRETYYPLEILTDVQTGAELDNIWNISLRTLQNCRHETYEDCRILRAEPVCIRFAPAGAVQTSSDDRLACKTQEFDASQGPDGLIKAQFPSGFRSTQIPQFSQFFVAIVYDHM